MMDKVMNYLFGSAASLKGLLPPPQLLSQSQGRIDTAVIVLAMLSITLILIFGGYRKEAPNDAAKIKASEKAGPLKLFLS